MKLLVVLILTAHVLLGLGSAWQESLTYDEIFNRQEGEAILLHGTFLDPYIPPFTKILTGIPFVWGLDHLVPSTLPGQQAIVGRIVTIVLSTILVYAVYRVSLGWFGRSPAFVSLFLAAFEPNLLGHNHYLTSDVPFALFFFCAYMVFPRQMFASGLALGLAMATKIPALLYFAATAIAVGRAKKAMFVLFVAFLVVWSTYGFSWDVVIAPREDSSRLSQQLIRYGRSHSLPFVEQTVGFLSSRPVPLGKYIALIKNSVVRGSRSGHPWYAMPATILLKTPIPLFTLFFIGMLKRRRLVPLIIPMIVILVLMSVTNLMPLVRYALPVYPFVILIASTSALLAKTRFQKILFIILLGWYVSGTIIQFPHFISYANEFAGPRERRFERLTDSNIDWGQSLPDLSEYVKRKTPSSLSFSYFGRDDAAGYGFPSSLPWGGYTFGDICAFHPILYRDQGPTITAISVSNWYGCGYNTLERFGTSRVKDVVGDSILIF